MMRYYFNISPLCSNKLHKGFIIFVFFIEILLSVKAQAQKQMVLNDIIYDDNMYDVFKSYAASGECIFKMHNGLLIILDNGYDNRNKEMCKVEGYEGLYTMIYSMKEKKVINTGFIRFDRQISPPTDFVVLGTSIYLVTRDEILKIPFKGSISSLDFATTDIYNLPLHNGNSSSLAILNDTTIKILNYSGSYGEYVKSPGMTGYYEFYTGSRSFSSRRIFRVEGISLSKYGWHRFAVSVGNYIVYSNGHNYSLSLLDQKGNLLDSLNFKSGDTSWKDIDTAELWAMNRKEIKTQDVDFNALVSLIRDKNNIDRMQNIGNNDSAFAVVSYHKNYARSEMGYCIDYWMIQDRKLINLATDQINYPYSNVSFVNNRNHFHHWGCTYELTDSFVFVYKNDYMNEEIRKMLLSEEKIPLSEYEKEVNALKDKGEEVRPSIFVYRLE